MEIIFIFIIYFKCKEIFIDFFQVPMMVHQSKGPRLHQRSAPVDLQPVSTVTQVALAEIMVNTVILL